MTIGRLPSRAADRAHAAAAAGAPDTADAPCASAAMRSIPPAYRVASAPRPPPTRIAHRAALAA
ncbi:hypothetical protein BMAJHU_I0730 [Burkholderia mallei JHU]|nr:hypothetical protein BMAJHU_I0730 [Burkholderia mallei JHU]EDU12720.1 hypothetical protein BURPS1655_D1655 [Burkholderia pseudomallei 1655]